MLAAEDTWSFAPSDVDLDEHVSSFDNEDFSNLSEENLRTLIKSFSETLRQRKSHLNLIYNLKDCQNKEQLVEELQVGMHSLEHDIKCLKSELDGRKSVKSKKCDEFIFPTITNHDDDTLDLTLLKQLIGPNFNGEDKLMFKSQYNALVHYSKSTPLNVRQLNQIFTIMLKGQALQYYTSLEPSLPLKVKIRNLLTVFSYRSSVADRLRDLENFERKPFEALDSVYLRLSSILDSTASLISPASRVGRSEHVLSHAIFTLAIPAAKHRLRKFRSEKTLNGQFLTSKELLKAAMRFEEGLANNERDPVPLNFRDPFLNPGETSKGKIIGSPQVSGSNTMENPDDLEENLIESQAVPHFWKSPKRPPYETQSDGDLKRNIQELSQQIDRLSKTYSEKMKVSAEKANPPALEEAHGIEEEPSPPQTQTNNKSDVKLGEFLESFLRAQYNFYKNFDYSSILEQKNPSYLRYAKWGSDFVREISPDRQRARYGDRRYNLANNSSRSPSFRQYGVGRQSGGYENQTRGYRTMPNNYRSPESTMEGDMGRRFPQPKRFVLVSFSRGRIPTPREDKVAHQAHREASRWKEKFQRDLITTQA